MDLLESAVQDDFMLIRKLSEQALTLQEQAIMLRKQALTLQEQAVMQHKQVVTLQEQAIMLREQALTLQEQAVMQREQVVMQREQTLTLQEQVVTQREQVVTQREQTLTLQEQVVTQREQVTTPIHPAGEELVLVTTPIPPADQGQITTRWTFLLGLGLTVLIGSIATLLSPLPVLSTMGGLTVALLLGLALRSMLKLPISYVGGVKFSAQKLLRIGIILTGVRLNFTLIASSGVNVLILDITLVTFGLLVGPWIATKLGLSKRLALLLSVGQSICGASAVGAIAALFPGGDENDTSLAIALCGLVGTVGVLLFTFGARLLMLPGGFYGLLVGSTLHEIAQVVAAGPAGGAHAADLAMVVKLTRVMLLAPVALLFSFVLTMRRKQQGQSSFDWKRIPLPWFVFGFLAVGVANSLGLFPKEIANLLLQASVFLLVVAMAAMGLMVDLSAIRQRGIRALGVALLLFVAVVIVSSVLLITVLGVTHLAV
jgi:uncharacterized integral membrane protein (TIGR00698 family)